MEEANKKIKTKIKKNKPGRGLETMYRVSMNNHVKFDQIADNKSNMLISINAIIISIVLTALLPAFLRGDYQVLIVPSSILVMVSLITITLAIIAAAPKNTSKIVPLEDYLNESGKLLFFGNFHQLSLEEYTQKMTEFQEDESKIYDALNQNFFLLGKVLAVKYKYLHISYKIFMYGLILSVVAFFIAAVIHVNGSIQ